MAVVPVLVSMFVYIDFVSAENKKASSCSCISLISSLCCRIFYVGLDLRGVILSFYSLAKL